MKAFTNLLHYFLFFFLAIPTYAQCPIGQEEIPVNLEIDLTGRSSIDLKGDLDNDIFTVCDPMAANAVFNLIGWSLVTANSVAPSLCSELQITVYGGASGEYDFVPGSLDAISGACNPYGTIHLLDISMYNIVADASGCVSIELSELLDNFPNAADATYSGGTITLQGQTCIDIVPTLSQWGVIILGLVLIIFGIVAVRNNSWQYSANN